MKTQSSMNEPDLYGETVLQHDLEKLLQLHSTLQQAVSPHGQQVKFNDPALHKIYMGVLRSLARVDRQVANHRRDQLRAMQENMPYAEWRLKHREELAKVELDIA